jgi:rod shape-determining protein MreC
MALTTVESEPGRFRSSSPGLRLALLCILSIVLMVLDQRNQLLVDVRKGLAVGLSPLQTLVSAPSTASRSLAANFASRSRLESENAELRRRELLQNARLQRMAALEAENRRLRALLDSTEKVDADIVIAEIVSVDMNPFRNMIVINKGSADNAFVGQPLIDADGIVGQITRDRVFSSEAMLVTDADHAIPIEIARNRLRTIAVGTGELNRLSLPFLPVNADVKEGDLLITSGLGRTFPPGYPVGTVRKVKSITGQQFLQIDAEPAAALNRIREVLLIAGATAALPPGAEDQATQVTEAVATTAPTDEAIDIPAESNSSSSPAPNQTQEAQD